MTKHHIGRIQDLSCNPRRPTLPVRLIPPPPHPSGIRRLRRCSPGRTRRSARRRSRSSEVSRGRRLHPPVPARHRSARRARQPPIQQRLDSEHTQRSLHGATGRHTIVDHDDFTTADRCEGDLSEIDLSCKGFTRCGPGPGGPAACVVSNSIFPGASDLSPSHDALVLSAEQGRWRRRPPPDTDELAHEAVSLVGSESVDPGGSGSTRASERPA